MPLDPGTLTLLLTAGAAISGGTIVREATKDGYNALKARVVSFLGQPAADILAALERQPQNDAARVAVAAAALQATPAQLEALNPLADALKAALAQDEGARRLMHERGQINLDFTAQGNVIIAEIDGATSMNVRADAGGDVSFTRVTIAGTPPGN
jgi:hypothetical protein